MDLEQLSANGFRTHDLRAIVSNVYELGKKLQRSPTFAEILNNKTEGIDESGERAYRAYLFAAVAAGFLQKRRRGYNLTEAGYELVFPCPKYVKPEKLTPNQLKTLGRRLARVNNSTRIAVGTRANPKRNNHLFF